MKFSKKLISFLTAVIAGVSCLAFTACGGCANSRLPDDGQEDEQPLPHVHSYSEWSVKTSPTCTEKGSRERVCECGEKQTEEVPASGHKFSEEWTKDGTYHWHASVCGHDVTDGKAEHVFENGRCKVCKKYAPLTADTDFGALVSEEVDEAGWKRAFENSFTDRTIKFEQSGGERIASMKFETIDERTVAEYEYTEFDDDGGVNYYNKFLYERDGEKVYMYSDIDMSTGKHTGTFKKHDIYAETGGQNSNMNDEVVDNWYMSYKMLCADFGEFYSRFVYNELTGAYELNCPEGDEIKTNDVNAYTDSHYSKASVKIVDGKLAYVSMFDDEPKKAEAFFFDYNNTTITFPEYEEA